MAKYYFDLREDGQFMADDEGQDFPDLDAAEHEAAQVAAEISRNKLPKGEAREIVIELRNEHGQRVLTATVALAIVRVAPTPDPPPR